MWLFSADRLCSTVGVHPTYCSQYIDSGNEGCAGDPDNYHQSLLALATSDRPKVVAIGECGLGNTRRRHSCTKQHPLQSWHGGRKGAWWRRRSCFAARVVTAFERINRIRSRMVLYHVTLSQGAWRQWFDLSRSNSQVCHRGVAINIPFP